MPLQVRLQGSQGSLNTHLTGSVLDTGPLLRYATFGPPL